MKALITGINGQDGYYLTQLLQQHNYEIIGVDVNRNSNNDQLPNVYYTDLTNPERIKQIILDVKPNEIYNLAAESNNLIAFSDIKRTHQINYMVIVEILDVLNKQLPSTKLFQAGSSLIFGTSHDSDNLQRETTSKDPTTPYGCDKLAAYQLIKTYRHHFNIFGVNGILYNHESPRRSSMFVVPKIIKHVITNYKNQTHNPLILGNVSAVRDWSHAKDFASAFKLMMDQPIANDYICSSCESHTVQDIINFVFTYLKFQLPLISDAKLINQKQENGYIGDNSKLINLGWKPQYNFEAMLIDIIDWYLTN